MPPAADRGLHLEEPEDAPARRHRPLVEVEGLAEAGQRPEQALGHVHQDREQADLQVAAQGGPAADEQGHREPGEDRHADERDERARVADGRTVGVAVGLAVGGHPLDLAVLGRERLDGGDAAEVVGQRVGDPARRRPHHVVALLEGPLVAKRAHDDHRDGQEGQERQGGRDDEERQADEHHVGGGDDEVVGADVEEPLELVHVVVEHGHEAARAVVLEVGQLELLDVAVGVHPGLVLHRLGQGPPEHVGDVVGDRLEDPHDHGDRRKDGQLVEPVRHPEHPPHQRLPVALVDDDVDGGADEQLRGHVADLVEHGEGAGQDHLAPVAPGVGPELPQWRGGKGDRGGIGGVGGRHAGTIGGSHARPPGG